MVNKVGIILPNLANSQLFFEASYNTKYIDTQLDLTLFFENLSPVAFRCACGIMHVSEILNFNGTLISTTLDNTLLSLKAINQAKKIFYVWDLEWIRGKTDYLSNIAIYQNPNLKLFTRSDAYSRAIYNYSNSVAKPSNLDIKELLW